MDGTFASRLRDIIESETFLGELARLRVGIRRWDEIRGGIDWALARNPGLFSEIPGTRLRVLKTRGFSETTSLRIFFVFGDTSVTLLWVEAVEEAE